MKPMNLERKASIIREAALAKRYPPHPPDDVTISRPCIIQDMHGTVITWYLPGILNDSRKVLLTHSRPISTAALIYLRVQ
jgi:hypothetical protein